MGFEEVLKENFDRVFKEVDYVKKTYNALKKFGFDDDNTIAAVCVCRDEISQIRQEHHQAYLGRGIQLLKSCEQCSLRERPG